MRLNMPRLPLLLLVVSAAGAADTPRSDLSRFDVSRSDFIGLRQYVDIRFDAQQKAVDKAEIDLNKRLDSVNEFRKQLADQTQTFITRNEYGQAYAALADKVTELTKRIDAAESRTGGLSLGWAYLVGALGVAAVFASIYQTMKKG
jgi:hypothetical protein